MCLCSPPPRVAEMCEGVSSDSDWESVEPQSFSFSRKRSIVCVENQEDMSYGGTPVKCTTDIWKEDDAAHAHSRARTRQSSLCCGKQRWRIREAVGMLVTEGLLRKWSST